LSKSRAEIGSPEWHAERRRIGWAVASEGGNLSDFARALGISKQAAFKWASRYASDLHRVLVDDGRRGNVLPPEARLERLITYRNAIRQGKTLSEAARLCGVSSPRLRVWLRIWAPDGVSQAIEDEIEASSGERENRRYG
jgi:transposase-like protein